MRANASAPSFATTCGPEQREKVGKKKSKKETREIEDKAVLYHEKQVGTYLFCCEQDARPTEDDRQTKGGRTRSRAKTRESRILAFARETIVHVPMQMHLACH